MSHFHLPAGTRVKYGAISTSLYPILRNGIVASTTPRIDAEGAAQQGIYVGELMSYFAACAAFCTETSELHRANEEVLGRFVQALQNAHGQKPTMPELESIAAQAGIPVVLELELAEACEIRVDENFADTLTKDDAEKSWKLWRCGAIVDKEVLPASWIKAFYFPRLLDYRDATSARNPRLLEQTTDSALMVGGLMQSWHKDAPTDLLDAFQKQYRRTNFSQHSAFDDTALERFFNLNAMLDPATRLLNQMTIWQDVIALANKQEIPLA